jgi:predicted transporter
MQSQTLKTYLFYVEISLLIIIAVFYFANFFKKLIPKKLYDFLMENRDTIVGLYYIYLAYTAYNRFISKN